MDPLGYHFLPTWEAIDAIIAGQGGERTRSIFGCKMLEIHDQISNSVQSVQMF